MKRVGFHCSHEQHAPSVALANVRAAERAGFVHAMCSDHIAPWSTGPGQNQSGYTWSWLGAALEATKLSFGTVTAPGQRYHPAITAHAIATLAEMYRGRLWVALGSGEALNEHITGDAWPAKDVRMARLRECVDVIRALLRGETVTHDGLVRVHEAKLYSRPTAVPPLIGAALSVETARWASAWADGLITVNGPPDQLRAIIDAFRGKAGDKPVYVQLPLAWARTDAEADVVARNWSMAAIGGGEFKADVMKPEYFDAAARHVPIEKLREALPVSSSVDQLVEHVARALACGADRVYIHHVGHTQEHQAAFLDAFAKPLATL